MIVVIYAALALHGKVISMAVLVAGKLDAHTEGTRSTMDTLEQFLFLASIGRPGTHLMPSDCDRKSCAETVTELMKSGHAITAEEIFEPGHGHGLIKIHHYRTCTICSEERKKTNAHS